MAYGRKVLGTIGVMSGVPFVPTQFMWSFQKMSLYNERHVTMLDEEILYTGTTFSLHSAARNSLVQRRQGEWLFMLDTDQVFDADVLGRLLYSFNEYELDVISGIYYQRCVPHCPVIYRYNEDMGGFQIVSKFEADSLTKIDAAGGGCLLVRSSVFDRIRKELGESSFDIRSPLGEDLSFFDRCRELNIEVWCDPRVKVGHLKMEEVTEEDSLREMEEMEHEKHETEIIVP